MLLRDRTLPNFPEDAYDCRLAWDEYTNVPYVDGMQIDTWFRFLPRYADAKHFEKWDSREIKCPGRPDKPPQIEDRPALELTPGRTVTRKLCIRIRLHDAADCPACDPAGYKEAMIYQELSLIDGIAIGPPLIEYPSKNPYCFRP